MKNLKPILMVISDDPSRDALIMLSLLTGISLPRLKGTSLQRQELKQIARAAEILSRSLIFFLPAKR